jgi:hypothetical protein
MKKLKRLESIPLNRKKYTKGLLEYRRNVVKTKTENILIYKKEKKSYFYSYVSNFIDTFSRDDDEEPKDFLSSRVSKHSMASIIFQLDN